MYTSMYRQLDMEMVLDRITD